MRLYESARGHALALVTLTALLLLPGCLQVVRQEAPYYKKGPHQVEPPDGFFEPGTHVWIFGEKDSYRRVLSFGGTAAYVWRQDLLTLGEWSRQRQQADKNE
ncbi:MAG: hypothetical protein KKI02_02550 [Planctomycetes bacterium]|nr:hypothetical protein [Planctomycetota bacterium]